MEFPRLVSIETTNRCNAKCSFCPNNALQRDRQVMDDDLFGKIVEDCTGFPLGAIEPFLQGEPFMDPRIFDRLELIRTKLPDTKLRLYSNGAALTRKKADLLRGLGVDLLTISLNTVDPERYDRIIGLPFDRTMDHLRYIASLNSGERIARRLRIRLTVTDETTWRERIRFYLLCAELRAVPMVAGLFNYKGDIQSDLPVPGYPCEHISRLDVMVSGETTLCCMDQDGEYGWGSVRDQSVLEVFNGQRAEHYKRMHREGRRLDCEPCDRCNLFWPEFSGIPLGRKLRFWGEYLAYQLRHRPRL